VKELFLITLKNEYNETKPNLFSRSSWASEGFFTGGPPGIFPKLFQGGKKCWNLFFLTQN